MSDPVPFKAPGSEPVADVIEMLERQLEWARSGELRGIAYVTLKKGDMVGTEFICGDGAARNSLVAGAGWLHQRMINNAFEGES